MGGCASLLGRSPPSVSKANTSPYIPDEFEVSYRLGKGGEGETFLAVHRETREQYALKVIRRASTINAKHLLSEIRIQSALCHANIVQLHEVLLDRRSLILVLQYIPGVSMADYLKTLRPAGAENLMPEATARFFFRQLLSALLHIQANNAAHRDLKLSNILVDTTASKKAPRLVLCDFGLSVDCENDICLHRSYTTVGTRQYMSPELLENHGAAHRKPYPPAKVDVWGLGILLYVFVVGRLPFLTCKGPADLKFDLMIASVREGHFDLCTDKTKDMFYNTHMSDSCQRLIRRMLALKPDTRISLMEVLEDPWTQGPLSKVHQAALDTMEQETRELARAACRLPRTCAEYRELEEIVREAGSGPALYSHVQADPPRDRLWRREPRFGAFDVDCGVPCVSGASRHGEDGTILRRWHPPERFCGGGGHPSIMELLEGSKSPSTQGGDSTLACNADAAMNDTAHTDTDGSKLVKLAFEASLSKDAADPHDSDSSGSDRYVTPVPTAKALCV